METLSASLAFVKAIHQLVDFFDKESVMSNFHYNDVIMSAMASRINSLTIV